MEREAAFQSGGVQGGRGCFFPRRAFPKEAEQAETNMRIQE